MKLAEIEERCKNMKDTKEQLEQHTANLKRLESEAKEKNKETQLLREIAKIRGEELPHQPDLNALEKERESVQSIGIELKKLEKETYDGLKEIALPIPLELPKVDPSGVSTILLEGGPFPATVLFLGTILSSREQMVQLDKTQFYPDRIVVSNVGSSDDVILGLTIFRSNLGRLARIALNEPDTDVEEVVEYLRQSEYHEIWEAIDGITGFTYENIFSKMNVADTKEKKRIRNFFTNLEKQLSDKFPFIRTSSGTYELSFFGALVWKRYSDRYGKSLPVPKMPSETNTIQESKESPKAAPASSLNNYFTKEDRKLIYGEEES